MPIPLRADFDAAGVRRAARESRDAKQVRRLLALAAIYDGATRTEAAAIGGVTLQIVRDWVLRFNAYGPQGLVDRKAPGQPSRLDARHRAALAAVIESGPIPAVHGVVRWRIIDLCQWVWDEFHISVSKQTLSRELRAMGTANCRRGRAITPRPRGRSKPLKKRPSRRAGGDRARAKPRSRRHRGLVRRRGQNWPEKQDHPSLVAARHPALGAARSADRLDLHLRRHLPQGGQGGGPDPAVVQHRGDEPAPFRDFGRGRAGSARGAAARSGRMAPLGAARRARQHHHRPAAAKCPELNPQENIWQFMRDNWLSNHIFTGYDNLVDHCCEAWNKLVAQPWTIMSIGLRDWAHRF